MSNQSAEILHHLKAKGPITPLEALEEYGVFRLGARIFDLRRQGHPIDRVMIETPSGKHVAQYSMGQT